MEINLLVSRKHYFTSQIMHCCVNDSYSKVLTHFLVRPNLTERNASRIQSKQPIFCRNWFWSEDIVHSPCLDVTQHLASTGSGKELPSVDSSQGVWCTVSFYRWCCSCRRESLGDPPQWETQWKARLSATQSVLWEGGFQHRAYHLHQQQKITIASVCTFRFKPPRKDTG